MHNNNPSRVILSTKKLILIADNCKLSSGIAKKQLQLWGASVEVINNIDGLLARAQQPTDCHFDAIFIDYDLFTKASKAQQKAFQTHFNASRGKRILMAPMSLTEKQTRHVLKVESIIFKPLTPSDLFNSLANEKYIEQQQTNKEPINAKIAEVHSDTESQVLLVEDNKVNQIVASALLRQAGVSFDIAENGLEAISYLLNREEALRACSNGLPDA